MPTDLRFVKGLHELGLALEQLPRDIGRGILRPGVAAGARVVKDAASRAAVAPIPPTSRSGKRRARQPSGTLARSAIIKYLASASNDTQIEYIVTFRRGKLAAKSGHDAYYAPWVERGHRVVPRSKRGRTLAGVLRNKRTLQVRRDAAAFSGSRVAAHPFFGTSFAASQDRALQAMMHRIESGLAQVLR